MLHELSLLGGVGERAHLVIVARRNTDRIDQLRLEGSEASKCLLRIDD